MTNPVYATIDNMTVIAVKLKNYNISYVVKYSNHSRIYMLSNWIPDQISCKKYCVYFIGKSVQRSTHLSKT